VDRTVTVSDHTGGEASGDTPDPVEVAGTLLGGVGDLAAAHVVEGQTTHRGDSERA